MISLMEFSDLFTRLLSIATVLGNLLTLILLVVFFVARPLFRRTMFLLGEYGIAASAFLATGATLGSLVYSEVVGFVPCILCWIQRAFIYPQMLFLLVATRFATRYLALTSFIFSILGGAVALYNWAKDMLALYTNISLACPVVPGIPSCDRIYVLEYGYVTIAMFSLNICILLGITLYAYLHKEDFRDPTPVV